MSTLDKSTPTQLQAGLNKDMTFQKNGDVTFALNGIRDAHDGGKYEYQSEPGNEAVQGLPLGFSFMGSINGNDNTVYIFATDNSGLGTIGTFQSGSYTEQVRTAFDWDPNFPITGEFRIKNGCEHIIYWCNGDTWDGFFNFDRPELFQDAGLNWIPNSFKLVPDVIPPKIDLKSVNDSGGFLPLGSYYFQAEYLDSSLNSIYKTDISPQTVIYDDSIDETYNQIDGGLNIVQYTAEIGGVPTTSKSITLTLSNLDTQFSFVRINVVRQIAATQAVEAHAVGQLIPINLDTIDFTYIGYDVSTGDYPIDYSEMITDNIRYDTAYVMEQVQGRLLRARLKQGLRDYSDYQKSASKIGVYWVAKEIEAKDVRTDGDPKNPKTYWDNTSFQGDEIYAIGVKYLHGDGTWSPVFHVPGRSSTGDDIEILTVVADADILGPKDVWLSDVIHLGLDIGDTIEKWKVFNTAAITVANTGAHPYDYEGTMGYYETETNYPDVKNCDSELIWGLDRNEDPIDTSVKIRHHRFPDRRMLFVHRKDGSQEFTAPYGIKFDNIDFPNNDVIGHQFCYVKRDGFNKTVLDSGWFCKQYDNGDMPGFGLDLGLTTPAIERSISAAIGGFMVEGKYGIFTSANIVYNKNLFVNDYIKFNRAVKYTRTPTNETGIFNLDGGGSLSIDYNHLVYETDVNTDRQNFKITDQVYLAPESTLSTGFPVNISYLDSASPHNVVRVFSELEDMVPLLGAQVGDIMHNSYAYKKSQVKPYSNLFNLDYKYINFNYNDSPLPEDNVYYNGDTLITLSTVTRAFVTEASVDVTAHNRYEEQSINVDLRFGGTDLNSQYYKNDGNYDWALNKFFETTNYNLYIKLSFNYPEYYAHNRDYNKSSVENAKSVLPITYNYCSDCLGEFNNKIVWSPKSFDEESFDLYRVNKVNDSITISGNRGKITGLKYQNDYLLTHTENSLYILQPNPQSLATDVSSVYLTTGGFLSLPPNEIVQNDIGYAGCQHKQHMCETPDGHAWCDQIRGQIFLFNTKLTELTTEEKGMTQWFRQELPSYLQAAFFSNYLQSYDHTSTLNILGDGVGIIMYYDPRFKRLIISKKDFIPLNISSDGIDDGFLYYDLALKQWIYYVNGVPHQTHTTDTTYFENKSWTISYSFNTGNFTSWHSYRPEAAFSDSLLYYTFSVSNGTIRNIWRHKPYNNYQKYYNTKYNFIIEWMTSDFSTDNFNSLHYTGYALSWDTTHRQWKTVDSTFQYGHVYSYDQSSNVFPMTLLDQQTNPYGNLASSNTQKYVIKTDNNYKISGIYDLATASPVVTTSWNFLKNFPGYIDQLVFAANHDNNKSAYTAGNIKDKFVLCRLFYNPNQDYKKVVTMLQTNETRSIR